MTRRNQTIQFVGLLFLFLLGSQTMAADDSWPQYAHDGARSGRTALQGDIGTPRESWSISLAGVELDLEILPKLGRHTQVLPGYSGATTNDRTIDLPAAPARDIDGSGELRPALETAASRWAKVLPDVPGLQQVRWDTTQTTAKICHLELIAYDAGHDKPRTVWQSEPEDTVFSPLCVVHDIDADGVQEICIAMHYRVLIFEGTTGRKETELRFHSSRSYGWFGLSDVDADGQMELVVLSDFQSHFDVLEFDPKKPEAERLSVKWRRDIETNIEDRIKWPQIGPRPLVDVTGDGRPEIVVNLYNDTGDHAWHAVVLDAVTGTSIADFPGRYTQGSADVDGDGDEEVFCAETKGVLVPEFSTIEIVDFAENRASVVWTQEDSGFGVADVSGLGPTWATGAAQGMRHILLTETERPAFLVRIQEGNGIKGLSQIRKAPTTNPSPEDGGGGLGLRTDSVALAAIQYGEDDRFRTSWKMAGLVRDMNIVALDADNRSASALVRVRLPARTEATLTTAGALPSVVSRRPLGTGGLAPIAARVNAGGPMHVFVEGASENLFAIRPPVNGDANAQIVWQRPGRGMGNGTQTGCAAAVDLNQDGSPEIIAADRSPAGAAVLAAYRADGSDFWRHTFKRTPGARPVHNVGALPFWWPGQFRDAGSFDILVNTRRGLMHSDVGHLLDGRTGTAIWSRDKATVPGVFDWSYTGFPIAVADVVADERDELINLYPVCFWIADGATGQIIEARNLADRKIVPAWAAYGEPTVWDFTGDGKKEILLDSVYILALLDSTGQPIWHGKRRVDYSTGSADDNYGETTGIRHAVVDFDGDGRVEIASGGYKDGVRAIDPRDGTILWSLDAPNPTRIKCSAADIDGNGGDELIYVSGNRLIAVTGDRDGGRILWRWKCDANLSLPAIADLDGDGRAEIVVQSADGVVHCIDGPAD